MKSPEEIAERERRAYAEGNVEIAQLLRDAYDAGVDVGMNEADCAPPPPKRIRGEKRKEKKP